MGVSQGRRGRRRRKRRRRGIRRKRDEDENDEEEKEEEEIEEKDCSYTTMSIAEAITNIIHQITIIVMTIPYKPITLLAHGISISSKHALLVCV